MSATPRGLLRRSLLVGGAGAVVALAGCGRGSAASSAGASRPADDTDPLGDLEVVDDETGSRVSLTVGDGVRRIVANGLPDHPTGRFPNPGNPNAVTAQSYDVTLPLAPSRADTLTPLVLPQPFGLAVNGVPFDPLAAEFWDGDPVSGWTYSALGGGLDLGLDSHDGHVQPTGAYHYHGLPDALAGEASTRRHAPLVGWAGDGFPVYAPYGHRDPGDPASPLVELTSSYRLRDGVRPDGPGGRFDGVFDEDWEFVPGAGALDEANGREGVTPEFPDGTYHYVLTRGFPYVPRAFAGSLAPSFRVSAPAGGPPGPPPVARP
ncbi:MAG: YHYH protein [Kineosporiaceae bacterium]